MVPVWWWIGALIATWLSTVSIRAQEPRTVWDGVYTESQAERGRAIFESSCLRCHGPVVDGVPQRFTADKFWASWGEDSLASLHTYLRRSMPNDAPGTLPASAYIDVVAYLVAANAAPAGPSDLTAETIPLVRLTRRSGDGALPEGALVFVTGCLTKTPEGWSVTRASAPTRARGSDASAELAKAADAVLGDSTFLLLFPLSSLDPYVGQRVLVRGLLSRRPDLGVNVMSVQTTARRCE